MAAQAPDPGYALVGRVSEAPPDGFSRMAAQAPDPGYALVGRVSAAPPGSVPDGGADA